MPQDLQFPREAFQILKGFRHEFWATVHDPTPRSLPAKLFLNHNTARESGLEAPKPKPQGNLQMTKRQLPAQDVLVLGSWRFPAAWGLVLGISWSLGFGFWSFLTKKGVRGFTKLH